MRMRRKYGRVIPGPTELELAQRRREAALDCPLAWCPVWKRAAWSIVPFPFPLVTSAEILEQYGRLHGECGNLRGGIIGDPGA